ncbi:MAG: ComF family protein [Planctomycetaceae bacterium]|nr:ComF family protein [Planctomycetaceae bacterium]
MRGAILAGKKSEGQPLITALTEILWQREREQIQTFDPEVIIAVPRHWSKELQHLDYAPHSMARVLGKRMNIPVCTNWLKRSARRKDQVKLKATERRINLKGAFRTKIPAGRTPSRVLLVDDVLTTGATANESAATLKKADVQQVLVAVLARGLGT